MKIVASAPEGHIGRRLANELLNHSGVELVLLTREPHQLREEVHRGANVINVDVKDRVGVVRATEGVDAMFWHIAPRCAERDFRAYQDWVAHVGFNAARANCIGHLVLLSSFGAHLAMDTGLVLGLHDAETVLRKAAPGVTILRPGYLMENYLDQLGSIRHHDRVYLPLSGSTCVPMVAAADVAAAAAKALLDGVPNRSRIVPLHGPKDYSFAEAAMVIGDSLRRTVRHVFHAPDQVRRTLLTLGASEDFIDRYLQMCHAMDVGQLRPEYPRSRVSTTPTRLGAFAREVLAPLLAQRELKRSS